MSINSIQLAMSVKDKNINDVGAAIRLALAETLDILKKKCAENFEFDIVRWSASPSNVADEIVLKSKIKNAINALNSPIDKKKANDSCANIVASYLIVTDMQISSDKKQLWANILLDMIIIGCNYQQKNSVNMSIINYLNQSNIHRAKEILSAYDDKNRKFNSKKLLELKGISLDNGHYQSFAAVTLFQNNGKQIKLNNSTDVEGGSPRAFSPDPETKGLLPKGNGTINSTEHDKDNRCSCWPWW